MHNVMFYEKILKLEYSFKTEDCQVLRNRIAVSMISEPVIYLFK